MDNWARRKLAELHAAAPVKRKKAEPPFVKVPLWWAIEAAQATRSPTTLVLTEILYRSWKAKSLTFSLPNGRLEKHEVNRQLKYKKLRQLEAARLITIEWRHGKPPRVTLVAL